MITKSIRETFGEQVNLIREYDNRKLLLRNKNTTLGNCVLIAKRDIATVSQINEKESIEYFQIIRQVESALKKAFDYDKINYLTLMMVDEHVHTHILPRYKQSKEFAGITRTDENRPGPTLSTKDPLPQEIMEQVRQEIVQNL